MQNKANFRKSQMNVNKVLTRNYEKRTLGQSGKNKANSKPNKANFKKAQMSATTFLAKDYENILNWVICENKANIKPKQTQSKPISPPHAAKQTQFQRMHQKGMNIEVADPAFRGRTADPAFRGRNQTQPVVSLPALSLPVLSIVEGSKGSNLFQFSTMLNCANRSTAFSTGKSLQQPLVLLPLSCGVLILLDLSTPEANIVVAAGIVERTHAELTPREALINSGHNRLRFVIEKDLNRALFDIPHQANRVPIVIPLRPLGPCFCNRDTRLVVDDKNGVGVGIGLVGDVHVIEMRWPLMAKEQAHITMAVISRCRKHFQLQYEAADNHVFNEVDIERRADFRAVLALFEQTQHFATVLILDDSPSVGVGGLPGIEVAILKVSLEYQRHFCTAYLRKVRTSCCHKQYHGRNHIAFHNHSFPLNNLMCKSNLIFPPAPNSYLLRKQHLSFLRLLKSRFIALPTRVSIKAGRNVFAMALGNRLESLVLTNLCRPLALTGFLEMGQGAFTVGKVFYREEQTCPADGDMVSVIQDGLVGDFAAIDEDAVLTMHISRIILAAVRIVTYPQMLA
jgi:hypothetical protein